MYRVDVVAHQRQAFAGFAQVDAARMVLGEGDEFGEVTRLTDPEKLGEALNIADLAEGILDRKLLSLSNGELRRVLLARMWMEKPEWVYFNDLFGGLDPEYRAHLAGCVADLAKRPGLKVVVRLAREDELLPEIPVILR